MTKQVLRFWRRFGAGLLAVMVITVSAACDRTKSATPLSPSLAGPIAGVDISVPPPMEPAAGRQYRDSEQPLTIVFGNAETNSVRPYTLTLQIATDAQFVTPVFSQSGISPAQDGVNRVLLPSRLPTMAPTRANGHQRFRSRCCSRLFWASRSRWRQSVAPGS
jgi:hypothetical protein